MNAAKSSWIFGISNAGGKIKIIQIMRRLQDWQKRRIADSLKISMEELERRIVLQEIINTVGYDPETVKEAQRQWIRLQMRSNNRSI